MRLFGLLLAALSGCLVGIIVLSAALLFFPLKKPEAKSLPAPVVHDVCRDAINTAKLECHTIPLYPGAYTVKDAQLWALLPGDKVFYMNHVEYVGPCIEKCEIPEGLR